MSMSGRNRFPFTASQWQELEHQALIFKYMLSGIPVPPDLLFTIKRSCFDPPLSTKLFSHQHQHVGWNCFQIGLGRKIDPEPGRCRRTDGKKWRCSKEAYPDSKYCERHMHRGKNRSRKPVEVTSTPPQTNPSTQTISSITRNSSLVNPSSETLHHQPQIHYPIPSFNNSHLTTHPFLYSSKPPAVGLSPQESLNLNSGNLVLDSGSFSQTDFRGVCSGLQSDYSYLQLQSLSDHNPKQQHKQQDQNRYLLGSDIKCELPIRLDREHEEGPQKTVHRFFDEWPPKTRDSWLDLDDKSSNSSSVSTTRLSISIPSAHDFPIFNSRAP
ncbi:hypothetical protein Patl1_13568 [Pistacia atlantica]|uniref:Uncharacterized protein n=1 Tax=Pistacia atlantica TaxID=434234 RepID=A0ACC1AW50_9ROSI|nr:hypothetical protein Patl1_13568 [Pistacia atlantica]